MALLSTWTQLTMATRREDMAPALEARIHDPLWLLSRQWLLGEFGGEDAGSPITVEVERDFFPLDRITLGGAAQGFDVDASPLQALVERETRATAPRDLRLRAQEGLAFLRALDAAGVTFDRQGLLAAYGFGAADRGDPDPRAVRLTRAAPDGARLHGVLSASTLQDGEIGDLIPGAAAPFDACRDVITAWIAGWEARAGTLGEGDAWDPERGEYAFSASVGTDAGRIAMHAPEYPGGRLDWDAFSVTGLDAQDAATAPERSRARLLATPAVFTGMPAPRFWEMEDARVDFGASGATGSDLGRLLLTEFVLAYGNDWFMVPVETPTGGLARINEVLVTDTFGVTTRLPTQSALSPHWRMNRLSQTGTQDLSRFLFLPPVAPLWQEGPAVEEVALLRDEMANMAWAVERVRAASLGDPVPVDGGAPRRAFDDPETGAPLAFTAISDLPENWIPLLPQPDPASGARYLARAGLIDELGEDAPDPAGVLLAGAAWRFHDEEAPRTGVRLTRAWRLCRWRDGGRALWLARTKTPGAGEMRSDLEFDRLTQADAG